MRELHNLPADRTASLASLNQTLVTLAAHASVAAGNVSEADRAVEADLARVLRCTDVTLEARSGKAPKLELKVLAATELQDSPFALHRAQERLAPIAPLQYLCDQSCA